MEQGSYVSIISDQTERALWEVQNGMDCVPNGLWNKNYCDMPLWKHIYHMLHSLDLWFINPRDSDFREPPFHEKDLNNLDVVSEKALTREQMNTYLQQIRKKIGAYLANLKEEDLLQKPVNCEYTRFTLILAQFRHLHTHMGILMGFIIVETGLWPRVVGLEGTIPQSAGYEKFF